MLTTGDKAGSPYPLAALKLERRGSVITSLSEDSLASGCDGADRGANSGFAAAADPARSLTGKGDTLLGGCFVEAEFAAEYTDPSRCVDRWLDAPGGHLPWVVGVNSAPVALAPAPASRRFPLPPRLHLRRSVVAKKRRGWRFCRRSLDAMLARESIEDLLRKAERSPAASAASASDTFGGRSARESAQAKTRSVGVLVRPHELLHASYLRVWGLLPMLKLF